MTSDEDIKYLMENIDQLETALRCIIDRVGFRMGWQVSDDACRFAENALNESKRIMESKK